MKVLFAVSNEEISESIVKKYQKQYKEIISYKNVYYFNAILKEIQKDKTYDRIVISEELEAFTSTQYDQIDKFIFDKLDSISDEASDIKGNDIPIILICSDRRTKSEALLVKLFGIGVYSALIGNDRSIDEVCSLIRRPRSKKEAKVYYNIDSEEVNYQAENENDVSEMEIQNIVAHYGRLGKNEDKYIESFNNIAEQYNDKQLRIITKFLPLNVRAVLEERSSKYQQIMSFNNTVSDSLRYHQVDEEQSGPSEKLLKPKTRDNMMSEPIVIPSSVNSQGTRKLSRTKNTMEDEIKEPIVNKDNVVEDDPFENLESINSSLNDFDNIEQENNVLDNKPQTIEDFFDDIDTEVKEEKIQEIEPIVEIEEEPVVAPVKRGRGRPRKNPLPDENATPKVKRGRGRPRKNPVPEVEESFEIPELNKEETVLPGLDEKIEDNNDFLPGFDMGIEENDTFESLKQNEKQEEFLPGFDDFNDILGDTSTTQIEEDEGFLPGFDDEENDEISQSFDTDKDDAFLPGLEDEEDNEFLSGFNTDTDDDFGKIQSSVQQQDNELLPGLDNYSNNIEEDNNYNNYNNINNQSNTFVQQSQPTETFNSYSNYNNPNVNMGYESTRDLSALLTPDKKIVTFVGTSKNGTSFIVNNIAEYMSTVMGINTAILDTTKNRNSYYIYTKNEEQLRNVATHSIEELAQGVAKGISANKNLTVYTSLPDENEAIRNVDNILETLLQNHSLVLIDTDFDTPMGYFKQSQETYLVQTLDVLTIQPLTAFLRELKSKDILDEKKLRIILNKTVKIRGITDKTIIGGMAYYNDPAMSFMTELFDRNTIKYVSIPFEEEIYAKYLQEIIECEISLKGYSKEFMQTLKQLANMIYSYSNTYAPPSAGGNGFSANMNNTLEQMRRNY